MERRRFDESASSIAKATMEVLVTSLKTRVAFQYDGSELNARRCKVGFDAASR